MSDQVKKTEPPPGFIVDRACVLDPLFGSWDRWAYRGRVGDRSFFGSGMLFFSTACEAAWEAFG